MSNHIKISPTLTLQYPTPFSPFAPEDFELGLKWASRCGFDGVELCISDYTVLTSERLEQLHDKLNSLHLGVSTISTGQAAGREHISLLSEDASLKIAQKRVLEHISAAKILGSKVTLGLLRGQALQGDPKENAAKLAENLKPLADAAMKAQVTLVLECINRYETALFNNAAEVLDFIERYYQDNQYIGVLYDLFHANIEEADMLRAIEELSPRLKHVHLADSNRSFPGYGHLNFDKAFAKLKEIGYTEYVSLECLMKPSLNKVLSDSEALIKKLRSI